MTTVDVDLPFQGAASAKTPRSAPAYLAQDDPVLKAAQRGVVSTYQAFWDHVVWVKGLDDEDANARVRLLLDKAAAVVARIRAHLDALNPGFQAALCGGHAREYLWGLDGYPTDDGLFIRSLVKASLECDDGSFVGGLTADSIDGYAAEILAFLSAEAGRQSVALIESFEAEWHALVHKVSQALAHQTLKDVSSRDLRRIVNMLRESNTLMHNVAGSPSTSPEPQDNDGDNNEPVPMETTSTSPAPEPAAEPEPEPEPAEPEPAAEPEPEPEPATEPAAEPVPMDTNIDDAKVAISTVQNDVSLLTSRVHHLKELSDQVNTMDDAAETNPKKSLQVLRGIQSRSIAFSEELMRDLIKLDSLTGLSNNTEARAERKAAVTTINQLLDETDAVKATLSKHIKALEERVAAAAAEEAAAAADDDDDGSGDDDGEEDGEIVEVGSGTEEDVDLAPVIIDPESAMAEYSARLLPSWKMMTLDPRFESSRDDDGVIMLSSIIPGMEHSDLSINIARDEFGRKALVVKGVVLPSQAQLLKMASVCVSQIPALKERWNVPDGEEETLFDALMLRLGEGRFGSWQQTFALPHSVTEDMVSATYRDDVLRISITPPPPQRTTQPRPLHPFAFLNPRQRGGIPFF